MTTTDPAGIGPLLADRLAAVHRSQEAACDAAGLARSTYYRRLAVPNSWTLDELARMGRAAGLDVHLVFEPAQGTPRAMRPATLDVNTDAG